MIDCHMNDVHELFRGTLTEEQANEIKYIMACYALDALHDSSVAEEVWEIAQSRKDEDEQR